MLYTNKFNFYIPKKLISFYPKKNRSDCRLLCLNGNTGALEHCKFNNLLNKLNTGDLLIFNNSKVLPARIYGIKKTGGKVEILIEKILNDKCALAHIFMKKIPKIGSIFILEKNIKVKVINYKNKLSELLFLDERNVIDILNIIGHIPLPPYILRKDQEFDKIFYQTIYNKYPGSIAAPTAGLHFDNFLMEKLKSKGIKIEFITLHIGSGTFTPIRSQYVHEHIMHHEYTEISKKTVDAILECKKRGNKVIAVGTSTVRSIESAAQNSKDNVLISPFFSNAKIFIYPGYNYRIIDAIITNFHFPMSTLILLVTAFAGYRNIINAYKMAIIKKYNFFSYGDAMFITKNSNINT